MEAKKMIAICGWCRQGITNYDVYITKTTPLDACDGTWSHTVRCHVLCWAEFQVAKE